MGQVVNFSTEKENPEFSGVKDVDVAEVNSLKDQLCLIDVRRPDEWNGELGHIPDARLMTLDTLPQRLSDLAKDETIVFICRSGRRSAQAASFAQENGFDQVYNMAGGMMAWSENGLEVEEKNA